MSKHHIEHISCPKCGKTSDFLLWESVNTVLDPDMKAKVRSGEPFQFTCPHCEYRANVDYAMLYHQMENHVMVYLVPGDKDEAVEMMKGIHRDRNGERIDIDFKLDDDYRNRVVGTVNQLREKLLILDLGLDDHVIELQKLFLTLRLQEDDKDIRIEEFLLDKSSDGKLDFAIRLEDGTWGGLAFDPALYDFLEGKFREIIKAEQDEVIIDINWAVRTINKKVPDINMDLLGNKISMWNPRKDVIKTDCKPLLDSNSTFCSESFFHWAYSLNTTIGLFLRGEEKTVPTKEDIGSGITFSYSKPLPIDLMLDDGKSCVPVMHDIAVWGTNCFDYFMVFSSNTTKQTFLIDSRGIIFELPCVSTSDKYGNGGRIENDKRNGCYLVNGVTVYYRTPAQRSEFEEKSKPISDAVFNKEFNRFTRSNAHNETPYLYLTAGESKCGALISFFGSRGMRYEIVPNFLNDDDTINVRIPLDPENAARADVQFLCAKYQNSYAIYGIPYDEIGGGFDFPKKWKQKQKELRFYLPKGKEALVYSIVDTLRAACGAPDDYEVYKKTISKVTKLFERGNARPEQNRFTQLLLLHPNEWEANDAYVLSRLDYINELISASAPRRENVHQEHEDFMVSLRADGYDISWMKDSFAHIEEEYSAGRIDAETVSREYDDAILGRGKHFSHFLYQAAYEESRRRYKAAMEAFESETLRQMADQGLKIAKWKNESNLFVLVAKEYPDAVYQYHCDWLGLQSLDVYIPSLRVGIEYQGEQHYRPIDFFGGEKAYVEVIARDKRKAELCKSNGVMLVYWRYDEPISKVKLMQKLKAALENS